MGSPASRGGRALAFTITIITKSRQAGAEALGSPVQKWRLWDEAWGGGGGATSAALDSSKPESTFRILGP